MKSKRSWQVKSGHAERRPSSPGVYSPKAPRFTLIRCVGFGTAGPDCDSPYPRHRSPTGNARTRSTFSPPGFRKTQNTLRSQRIRAHPRSGSCHTTLGAPQERENGRGRERIRLPLVRASRLSGPLSRSTAPLHTRSLAFAPLTPRLFHDGRSLAGRGLSPSLRAAACRASQPADGS